MMMMAPKPETTDIAAAIIKVSMRLSLALLERNCTSMPAYL